jgi:hypothetical protein
MNPRCFGAVNGWQQIPAKLAPRRRREYWRRVGVLISWLDIFFRSGLGGSMQRQLSRRKLVGLPLGVVLLLGSWCGGAMAQKLVDPNSVAPEFRDAAVKRRNEQIKLAICAKKADDAKVLRRDRAEFVDKCLER